MMRQCMSWGLAMSWDRAMPWDRAMSWDRARDRRVHGLAALLVPALLASALPVAGGVAADEALHGPALHGLAMHGQPRYGPDFPHLDYVNPEAPKGGVLRLAASGSFDTLNPFAIRGRPAAGVRERLYETLMRRTWDEPFSMYGLLAETAHMPADRSWVAFTLRPGARFSDGTPVTVADVIFSWETIRTRGKPNSRATFNEVARVEQTGPGQVRFVFKDTSNRELPLLIGGFLPILSKSWWEGRDFAATSLDPPVSSGPYRIESAVPGRQVVYRRDPDYWGARLPLNVGHNNFDRIVYDYYRDDGTALQAFKAGDYDFRLELDPVRWATQYDFPASRDGRVTLEVVEHGIASGLRGFYMNLRRPLFRDRRVRKALLLAFDFEWVNASLLNNAWVRTASLFDNSGLRPVAAPSAAERALLAPWRDQVPAEVFGPPFAPPVSDGSGQNRAGLRAAAGALAAAGWTVRDGRLRDADGTPFKFDILLLSPSNEKIALAYKRNLERLGMDVGIRLVDSAQYRALIDDFDFDMVLARRAVTLSPGNEQANYWGSAAARAPGSRNISGIEDAALDAMIAALMQAPDREALATAARALDRILMWNYYVIPLYHRSGFPTARWNTIARPATTPVYGAVIETFWSRDP